MATAQVDRIADTWRAELTRELDVCDRELGVALEAKRLAEIVADAARELLRMVQVLIPDPDVPAPLALRRRVFEQQVRDTSTAASIARNRHAQLTAHRADLVKALAALDARRPAAEGADA